MKINWERTTLIFVGILTLLRLAVAPTFGLGVDEAHYFLYAYFLDWSYVDHPPLVGWTHWPLYALFGTNEFLVRLPAILLFAGVSLFVYRFTLSFSESGSISFLSVVAVNSSFILNAMGIMLLPDCFLLLLVFPLMTTIRKISERGEIRHFVCLGLLLGLAGLAKYTAVLFVPPLLIFLIMKKRYNRIFSPGMFLAAGIALLMISPVLYWNMQNDYISFRYQGGHVLAATSPMVKSFFVSLLTQFGAYSPFLFLMAFYGLYKGWKSTDDRIRLSVLFGVFILLFFFYSSLYERTLPHWPSLFYLLFIPIGAYYLLSSGSSRKRKYFYFSVVFSLTITLFLYAALPAKWFTFPDYKSPFRDIVGFETIAREGDALLRRGPTGRDAVPPPRRALAVTNWTMGSRMLYYNLPYGHEVYVTDDRKDQFDVWQQTAPKGYDLLFVNTHFHQMDVSRNYRCDASEPVKKIDIILNGGKVDTIEYVWCRNYQGPR
jgi:4-amino-4-deoxy-L-arabinose transferase-like glycosyltransferase